MAPITATSFLVMTSPLTDPAGDQPDDPSPMRWSLSELSGSATAGLSAM